MFMEGETKYILRINISFMCILFLQKYHDYLFRNIHLESGTHDKDMGYKSDVGNFL